MPIIIIEPGSALIDVPRAIRLFGLTPGERVTIVSTLGHDDGTSWRGETAFAADERGEVDLARDAPVAGGYEGVSPMGVVWSMRQVTAPPLPSGRSPAGRRFRHRRWPAPPTRSAAAPEVPVVPA